MNDEFEYESIESYKLKGITFTCASKWNSMEEWRDTKGNMLIVMREPDGIRTAFDDALGLNKGPRKTRVIAGSPELLALLKK